MIKVIKKHVDTILRPTGINLAPYVINPYQGCQMGCLFCYAQFSKVAQREQLGWGKYVKVKINALEILQKELDIKSPGKVLIGSTTEPFQPVERNYGLSRGIIQILNKRKIKYVIMSRSMLLGDYIDELEGKLCEGVYFTVDTLPDTIKKKFEPYAASSDESISLVNRLNDSGINVIAYFCPVMPFLHKQIHKVRQLNAGISVEFEIVNFQMSGIKRIIQIIEQISPDAAKKYKKMCTEKLFYDDVMRDIKSEISQMSGRRFKGMKIHQHKYTDYFKNIY